MEKPSKGQRGGAFRVQPPHVSSNAIYEVFKQFLSFVGDFGTYESLSRNTQPDGSALVKLDLFLTSLLQIAPSAEIGPGVLKKAYEQIT